MPKGVCLPQPGFQASTTHGQDGPDTGPGGAFIADVVGLGKSYIGAAEKSRECLTLDLVTQNG